MKILIILKSIFPMPLNSGGQQALFHMIDYLRKKMQVSIIYDAKHVDIKNEAKLKRIWPDISFFSYKKPNYKYIGWNSIFAEKLCAKLINSMFIKDKKYVASQILKAHDDYDNDFLNFINSTIKSQNIDIVQTEFMDSLSLVHSLPENVSKIFVHHEIGYIRNRLILNELNCHEAVDKYRFNRLKALEICTLSKYDAVVTLTDDDAKKLKDDGVQTKIISSPACIPTTYKNSIEKFNSTRLTFLGGFNHKPNSDGLKWFLDGVWNTILSSNCDVTLEVIGSWPKSISTEWEKKYKNLTFRGIVEDLGTILPSSVMIIPIHVGSGMRMKILDAVNYGCPFVSTHVGVEGLKFADNQSCFIEDEENKFAEKVLELLNNKNLQRDFVINSKAIYDKNYSIDILGAKRFSVYKNILAHQS